MKPTIKNAWDLLKIAYLNKEDNFNFDENLFEECYKHFKYWHKLIQKEFMKDPKKELDRHKIAAILTISIIQTRAITYNKQIQDDKIFIGGQLLAITCGLSYMQDQLNQLLTEHGYKTIDKYDLPSPFSCDTNYLEVLARNLYYQEFAEDSSGEKLWRLNPLSLANDYYLIEYITLLTRGIPIEIFLKEVD